jgi:hypothetical protein
MLEFEPDFSAVLEPVVAPAAVKDSLLPCAITVVFLLAFFALPRLRRLAVSSSSSSETTSAPLLL